ncbi:MAG TPA: metallophosphoesterase [Opitutales bacterium]|nr:metallophosphoesterase [Opitutales bacterium]
MTERGPSRWSGEDLAGRRRREFAKEKSDRREESGLPRRMLNPSFWVKAVLGLGLMRGAGLKNALAPRVVERTETFPNLPAAFDGFRILHVSDLHLDLMPQLADVVRGILAGLDFDIVAATGDFRDSLLAGGESGVRLSAELLAGTGRPVYACLGNHDLASDVDLLESAGIVVLVNEGARLARGDSEIFICGVDDPGYHRLDDFAAAFRAVPAGAFAVALSHDPCGYVSAGAAGASFMLSGHPRRPDLPAGRARPLRAQPGAEAPLGGALARRQSRRIHLARTWREPGARPVLLPGRTGHSHLAPWSDPAIMAATLTTPADAKTENHHRLGFPVCRSTVCRRRGRSRFQTGSGGGFGPEGAQAP